MALTMGSTSQLVFDHAYQVALEGGDPREAAAEVLALAARDRHAIAAAHNRFLGVLSEGDDREARLALNYLEQALERGDDLGVWSTNLSTR